MRAAVVAPPGQPFAIEERPDPTPGDDEVVVKVGRCGICGTDLHWTSGHSGNGLLNPPGSIIGHEWAGEVVARGRNVTRTKVGDIIAGMCGVGCGKCSYCLSGEPFMCDGLQLYVGGFGQYMLSHNQAAVVLPRTLSLADGAMVEPLAVGLHGFNMSGMKTGDRVLVLGGGAVALCSIYWARRFGAGRIVAASRSPRRAELAMAMGADEYVVTGEDDVARVNAALGSPPDVIFEGVGVKGMLAKSIAHIRRKGTVVSLGFCTVDDPIVPGLAAIKQVNLRFPVAYTLAEFEQAARVLDKDAVPYPTEMVTETVGLDAFPAKIEELRGANNQTKVHLDPWA
jgi:threonine dehydrogenase-like Zn-dependent dehydrogenase